MTSDDQQVLPSAARWAGLVGLVVAPTTLVTSLCYYFGYIATRRHLLYLGIDPEAVGYTSSDYVTKSIGVMYVLSVVLLAASAVALLVCAGIRRLVAAGRFTGAIRRLGQSAVVVGALAAVLGVSFVVHPCALVLGKPVLVPSTFGIGAALVIFGCWTQRVSSAAPRKMAGVERSFVMVAVALSVIAAFWAVNIFAEQTGEIDGINEVGRLWWRESNILLDTKEQLYFPDSLVKEEPPLPSPDPAEGPTFRYQCFRAIVIRGDRWVLVPAKWTPEKGYATVVVASPSTRITMRRFMGVPRETGQAPNVWRYWQCPEVVPRATGSDVEGMLLGAAQVTAMLGSDALGPMDGYTVSALGAQSLDSCAGAADSSAQVGYPDSGFVVRHVRKMSQDKGLQSRNFIQQEVIEFKTPAGAAEFVDKSRQSWEHCARTRLKIAYPDGRHEQRVFGDTYYSDSDDILTIVSTVENEQRNECAHALAAKSNVVVDVQVCGPTSSAHANTVLDAIRNGFPLS